MMSKYKGSIKKLSFDKTNEVYLSSCNYNAIDLDLLKGKCCDNSLMSPDCIFQIMDEFLINIICEFKNQKMRNIKTSHIVKKFNDYETIISDNKIYLIINNYLNDFNSCESIKLLVVRDIEINLDFINLINQTVKKIDIDDVCITKTNNLNKSNIKLVVCSDFDTLYTSKHYKPI